MTVIRFTHNNELDYAPCIAEYVMACLMMSGRDMAKMPSYIRDLIGSLRDSGAADAGNCLYNPSRYNPEVTRIAEGPGSYRKPEIEIYVAITKKGNLTVTWYPLHHFTSGILKTDSEHRVTNSSFHYFSEFGDNWNRPPNELLFLRSFEDHFTKIKRRPEPVELSEANV